MAVQIQTYLWDEVTSELLEKYFEVKRANDERVRGEEEVQLLEDQFEPGRKDLVGLVVARENENLVGGIKLFKRSCVCDSTAFILGGFGGVFTANEYKRQGVATMMLAKSLWVLGELQVDVAYLCTDIEKLEKLYWPFGFRHLKQGHTFLGKSEKRYTEYDGMLAMVNSWEIFSQLITSDTPIDIGQGNW
jgi:predicted N-acetyltransferase YhbS